MAPALVEALLQDLDALLDVAQLLAVALDLVLDVGQLARRKRWRRSKASPMVARRLLAEDWRRREREGRGFTFRAFIWQRLLSKVTYKCQALIIVRLNPCLYTTMIARIRCYTMLSTILNARTYNRQ